MLVLEWYPSTRSNLALHSPRVRIWGSAMTTQDVGTVVAWGRRSEQFVRCDIMSLLSIVADAEVGQGMVEKYRVVVRSTAIPMVLFAESFANNIELIRFYVLYGTATSQCRTSLRRCKHAL